MLGTKITPGEHDAMRSLRRVPEALGEPVACVTCSSAAADIFLGTVLLETVLLEVAYELYFRVLDYGCWSVKVSLHFCPFLRLQ
jgi:hypothetical protein